MRSDDGEPFFNNRQPQPAAAQTGQATVFLQHAPNIPMFSGSKDDEWPQFKQKFITTINLTGQDDERAASQFSTYLEGSAYRFWNSLPKKKKKNIKKVFRAFDKKYADEIQQGYWQMEYENLRYEGPSKETLDDLAVRIQDTVARAYPDYRKPDGNRIDRSETRRIYTNKKFFDCMDGEIQELLLVKFGGNEAKLRDMLNYAKRRTTAKMRTRKRGTALRSNLCSRGKRASSPQVLQRPHNGAPTAKQEDRTAIINAPTEE